MEVNIYIYEVNIIIRNYRKYLDKTFDIIRLSETHNNHDTANCNLEGYELYYNNSTINKGDGFAV